ncbi:hypothetical protein FQA39_LY05355 [Lamprigera yunnana]|nr:hypothetical protein FQA39_LY05355 [Lamprigera yunnana]
MFLKNVRHVSNVISKNRLDGKVAIVTASTDGIGFAIAKRLAQDGAKVVISSRKQQNVDKALAKLASEGLDNSVIGTVCHVLKAEDRKKLFEEAVKIGGLDILISNAAINPTAGHVLECDEGAWDKIFDTNVKAAYLLAKEALPLLRKRDSGRIIFISSIAGYVPHKLIGAYSVSKTALLGLTKAASLDLASQNITVNCIAPGIIETKFSEMLIKEGPARDLILSKVPMNRIGKPNDVAAVAAFLSSEDSQYITGETIVVSGGMDSRL